MKRHYPICVPEQNFDDKEYSDLVKWCSSNYEHPNVLVLEEEDVYDLQNNTEILKIINDENGGMIGISENDWLIHAKVKENILKRLKSYAKKQQLTAKAKDIMDEIIRLLSLSIETQKNMYFLF